MNIRQPVLEAKRQTTAEEVFRQLQSDIISMQLVPGAKISEVEVAKNYDVSRQPVREAFMRLGDLNLLEIRPQRATLVRKISIRDLDNTRFIRAAVEVEVIREACKVASIADIEPLEKNLEQQKIAVDAHDAATLKELDYEFHRLICVAARRLPAFKTIAENKSHTDRVCTLELADPESMIETFEGHVNIVDALKKRDEELAVKMTRIHLAHLDSTLELAHQNHPDYFEV
jgi:DNA-binding GntR family transcriptional regulator